MDRDGALRILGEDDLYDRQQIKAAFRRACLTAHPDKGGSHEEFLELKRAYDFLMKIHFVYIFSLKNSEDLKFLAWCRNGQEIYCVNMNTREVSLRYLFELKLQSCVGLNGEFDSRCDVSIENFPDMAIDILDLELFHDNVGFELNSGTSWKGQKFPNKTLCPMVLGDKRFRTWDIDASIPMQVFIDPQDSKRYAVFANGKYMTSGIDYRLSRVGTFKYGGFDIGYALFEYFATSASKNGIPKRVRAITYFVVDKKGHNFYRGEFPK